MLIRAIHQNKNGIGIRVKKFGLAITASPPLLDRTSQLVFLCGANDKASGKPSARREAIKIFVEKLSPNYKVIYAEGVFTEITKMGQTKNVLDLEQEISAISDKILIVLESPSAFCELGAFSHQTIREKLIIINNSEFRGEDSFINLGPIAAAEEAKAHVIWYPMMQDGIYHIDGIGTSFNDLKKAIELNFANRGVRVSGDISKLEAKKESLYFIHDLVLFTGPISKNELINFMIVAFGKKSYDILSRLLGILCSAGFLRSFEAAGSLVYESSIGIPFFKLNFKVSGLIATFRNFHLRNNPSRFEL